VLEVGKRYTSPKTGTWVQIAERSGEVMRFERSLAPDTGRADPHLHQDLTQTWEVLSGDGMIDVDGVEREFRAGDRVAIEPGTTHRDPWNPSSAELHVRGIFDPDNDFIEGYAAAYAHHLTQGEDGRLNDQDELPLLQILVVAQATNGRSYGASPPVAVQKALLPMAAAFGRLRGYKPSYD
jgi:mannose-6-phosphate isomerase-like protein (cupin superfamily)